MTPSSKVVGDLAQFMVQNELDEQQLVDRADTLAFPNRYSVIPGYPSLPLTSPVLEC